MDPRLIALCLGGAACLWDDLIRTEILCGEPFPGLVVATNWAAVHYPGRVDILATLHVDQAHTIWRPERAKLGRNTDFEIWGRTGRKGETPWYDADGEAEYWQGSSGILATTVALVHGATRVLLAGMPITATAHFNHPGEWCAMNYEAGWALFEPRMRGRVKSWSGYTRELLGEPTRAWLLDAASEAA